MALKQNDEVAAAVEMRSGTTEWPWRVPEGAKGLVKSAQKGSVEVHFDCGVVRICKESELRKWGK